MAKNETLISSLMFCFFFPCSTLCLSLKFNKTKTATVPKPSLMVLPVVPQEHLGPT